MSLRDAIDKAREEIDKMDQQVHGDQAAALLKVQDSSPLTGNEEWTAPEYNQSARISLDADLLMKNRCFAYFHDRPEVDNYRVLRTQILQRTREKNWNTIMITSAVPGEGKTLTAINLALTFAKEFNQTVLLVDADLRNQRIHDFLGFKGRYGLGDYLVGNQALADIMVWPGIEKLSLVSGGKTMHDSAELLGSPKMKALVAEMKVRYADRYIMFDAPAVLGQADAIAFAPAVDCVLMVVESGRTSLSDIKEALRLIPEDKFLGFVLNRHSAS